MEIPTMARNYKGDLIPMPKPSRAYEMRVVFAACDGFVQLWVKDSTDPQRQRFAVVYGLELHDHLTYNEAMSRIGACIMHSLRVDGRLGDD